MRELVMRYRDINTRRCSQGLTQMDYLKYAKFSLESMRESMENYDQIPEVDSPFLSCSEDFSFKGSVTDRSRLKLNRMDHRLSMNGLDDSL